MKIHFTNARIMPVDGGVFTGDLITENGKIVYMGETADRAAGSRVIDLQGNLIMPGFKNAHAHSPMTFLRSFADDLPLAQWLNEQVFPREDKLTPEDVYWLSKLAFLEYLTSGITASFDMYFHLDAIAEAAVEYGFRTVFCGAINRFGGTVASEAEAYEKYNHYHERISYQLGFHAEYTTDLSMMAELAELASSLRKPVFAHNSETREEVDGCLSRYGKTPTELMNSLGLFEYGGGGFHCVHFTRSDRDIFREKGLWAVTNPASNLKLSSGIAELHKMREAGVRMAIGTDGPASNNCLDMFREMFLVTGLQKVITEDPSVMPADFVLRMAAQNGALAMGLDDCDCLAVGKRADLIVIDLNRPNMQPLNDIGKNIVYSGSKDNIYLTMINGKILYEKGEFFVGEDPSLVYEHANQIIRRIAVQ